MLNVSGSDALGRASDASGGTGRVWEHHAVLGLVVLDAVDSGVVASVQRAPTNRGLGAAFRYGSVGFFMEEARVHKFLVAELVVNRQHVLLYRRERSIAWKSVNGARVGFLTVGRVTPSVEVTVTARNTGNTELDRSLDYSMAAPVASGDPDSATTFTTSQETHFAGANTERKGCSETAAARTAIAKT